MAARTKAKATAVVLLEKAGLDREEADELIDLIVAECRRDLTAEVLDATIAEVRRQMLAGGRLGREMIRAAIGDDG